MYGKIVGSALHKFALLPCSALLLLDESRSDGSPLSQEQSMALRHIARADSEDVTISEGDAQVSFVEKQKVSFPTDLSHAF